MAATHCWRSMASSATHHHVIAGRWRHMTGGQWRSQSVSLIAGQWRPHHGQWRPHHVIARRRQCCLYMYVWYLRYVREEHHGQWRSLSFFPSTTGTFCCPITRRRLTLALQTQLTAEDMEISATSHLPAEANGGFSRSLTPAR